MPKISGVEMAIQIKERYPACKILLFSGNTETTDLLEAARMVGRQFPLLPKPFHPEDLLAKLDEMSRASPSEWHR